MAIAKVKSCIGIDRAEIEVGTGVTLLAGVNGEGKSSIIEAVRCVLTASNTPLKLAKKDIGFILHNKAKEGFVEYTDKNGSRKVSWPQCEVYTPAGRCISLRGMASGSMKYSELTNEQRSKILSSKLEATVTPDRLKQELEDIEAPEAVTNKVVELVFGNEANEGKGMKSAEDYASIEATNLKRKFQKITGKRWGTKQGRTFKPENYEARLDDHKDDSILQKNILEARESLEAEIAKNAISEDELSKLEELVATEKDEKKKLKEFDDLIKSLEPEIGAAEDKFKAAKDAESLLSCTACGVLHRLVKGELVAADVDKPPEELGDLKELEKELTDLKTRYSNALTGRKVHQSNMDNIIQAKAKIKKIDGNTTDGSAVDEARKSLEYNEKLLKAWEVKQQGLVIHEEISAYIRVSEICGSDGLEKQMLIGALGDFNEKLAALSKKAGWKVVSIDNDLGLRYNGHPFVVISRGEKYRANATIQIAIALIDKSPLVIFDDADDLDKDGRNQFFRLLISSKIPALVGMAVFPNKAGSLEVPDLKEKGIGRTYWVREGTAELFQEVNNGNAS